jgi:predicted methyltransferase
MRTKGRCPWVWPMLLLAGCGVGRGPTAGAPTSAAAGLMARTRAVVAAPDRSADDRALDEGRHPAETLAFFGIDSGQTVAELAAGRGYTAELLARTVGPTGRVYGMNTPFLLARFAAKPWAERLMKPVMKPVEPLEREFDDPLPPELRNLDAVLMILFYHDTVWQKADRARMNAAVFRALKPGGIYGIIDHSARPGTGLADVQTFHRIEEAAVRTEIEAAGFRLAETADFLRNPSDPRDWNDAPTAAGDRRGTSDRFVLKFVKP